MGRCYISPLSYNLTVKVLPSRSSLPLFLTSGPNTSEGMITHEFDEETLIHSIVPIVNSN